MRRKGVPLAIQSRGLGQDGDLVGGDVETGRTTVDLTASQQNAHDGAMEDFSSAEPKSGVYRSAQLTAWGGNLTYNIVQDLGIGIVTGRYSDVAGFPVESELASHYRASRTAVREAVKMLTAKGLLGSRPRQGTRVEPEHRWNLLDPDVLRWLLERKFSLSLLKEFIQMRLAVEPEAAALAAISGTQAQKSKITAAIERMIAASHLEDDPLSSDIAFHVAVLEASGNRFYIQLRDLIATALRFSIRQTNNYKGVRLASVMDHKRISDAILSCDPQAASNLMRALVQEALNLVQDAERKSSE